MKKILSIVLAVALVTVMFTGSCFAGDYRDDYGVIGDNEFQATLSLAAKSLKIELYDGITFSRYTNGGLPATTIRGQITIINASGYDLSVVNIHYDDNSEGDWEMVAKDSEFSNMKVETKKYALYIGDVDFLTDDYDTPVQLKQDQYSPTSIEIMGYTARTIMATNEALGTFTVTIALDE